MKLPKSSGKLWEFGSWLHGEQNFTSGVGLEILFFPCNGLWREFMNDAEKLERCRALNAATKWKPIVTTGYVYLMRNKRNGYIKIGFSKDPKHREATLQSQEPEVQLINSTPGTIKDEWRIQAEFASKRLRGEWFKLSLKDLYSIESMFMGMEDGRRWVNEQIRLQSLRN